MLRMGLTAAVVVLATGAGAEEIGKSGRVKHSAYAVCRQQSFIDLGEVGSDFSADCTGIVRAEGGGAFDNMALHCLEGSVARKSGYRFTGSCIEMDGDGDKVYFSYEGPEDGPIAVLGGTGKFKGIAGKGEWKVTDAPGNTDKLFAFRLDYGFEWTRE